MKEALLRNPFDAVEAPGKPARTINRVATTVNTRLLALPVR